ncbi:hypothetical protein HY045_03890 [Candidatus Woesebacteria bacterium]|nr:hypothetical protein [Candidatus Woesebacteria bacterium]
MDQVRPLLLINMALFKKFKAGQSMVELLLAMGIAAAVLPAILTGFIAGREGKVTQDLRLRATAYLREGQEATRVFREKDWIGFAVNGTYHPVISGSTWILSSGSESISDFTRAIVVSDIIPVDPSIKLVTTTVSWGTGSIQQVSAKEYFTRYVGNSVQSGTGTIQAAGGFGNWCLPSQSLTTVDLSRQGVPTTVWAFEVGNGTGNRVFSGTGGNSSGPAFTNTRVIGNSPPVASSVGDYNDTPKVKVNGVFGDGNFAYLTTDSNSEEVKILDLSQFTDPPTNSQYKKIGWFDSSGSTDGNSVSVSGNTGFMTAGNKFYAFDLSSKTGSRPQIGLPVTLPGTGVKIYMVGSYAYVAISGSSTKMQIVNISNPANLALQGSYVNSNLGDGRDIFINSNGTRAYLVTGASATQPEFFIIDTTNKSNPVLVSGGSYDTNGMDPQGVILVTDFKAIIVGKNGTQQYQVIDISNESALTSCGTGLPISGGIFAISSLLQSDGHAYSYIVTGDTHAELKIIEGGAGGGGGTGTFESSTFDAGHDVAFNSFVATSDPNLTYKVSIKHGSGGNCSGVNFADSDFVIFSPGPLPLSTIGSGYVNPGQCMRYRVINTGGSAITYSINFNYSP